VRAGHRPVPGPKMTGRWRAVVYLPLSGYRKRRRDRHSTPGKGPGRAGVTAFPDVVLDLGRPGGGPVGEAPRADEPGRRGAQGGQGQRDPSSSTIGPVPSGAMVVRLPHRWSRPYPAVRSSGRQAPGAERGAFVRCVPAPAPGRRVVSDPDWNRFRPFPRHAPAWWVGDIPGGRPRSSTRTCADRRTRPCSGSWTTSSSMSWPDVHARRLGREGRPSARVLPGGRLAGGMRVTALDGRMLGVVPSDGRTRWAGRWAQGAGNLVAPGTLPAERPPVYSCGGDCPGPGQPRLRMP